MTECQLHQQLFLAKAKLKILSKSNEYEYRKVVQLYTFSKENAVSHLCSETVGRQIFSADTVQTGN